MDGGVYENDEISIEEAAEELLEDEGWTGERIRGDYDVGSLCRFFSLE